LFTLLGLAALLAASPPPSATPEPMPHPITTVLGNDLDTALGKLAGGMNGRTPAIGIAVTEAGKTVYARGFGQATATTRFDIASITKLFTAVAVMQLVEHGRVSLDAPVAHYLTSAPYADRITIRECLQHTSGLWNYLDDAFKTGAVAMPTTPLRILELAARHPLEFSPGSKYAYSNTGYVVLGQVVEKVTGEALAAYEQTHIFDPAGMHDTTIGDSSHTAVAGYMTAARDAAPPFDFSWLYADGDIVSTAADLARFDAALLNETLISASTLATMQADRVATDGRFAQGLGFELADAHGLHFVGHHGGVPGFESDDQLFPAQRLGVVVLGDTFDFPTSGPRNIVLSALFPQTIGKALAERRLDQTEDLAVTAKFRAALTELLRGALTRSNYTPAMNTALTDTVVAGAATQLRPLGPIVSISFASAAAVSAGTAYRYVVNFSNGTSMTWHSS
jgi:D-alanyl-D-alanine carboxypeptidase